MLLASKSKLSDAVDLTIRKTVQQWKQTRASVLCVWLLNVGLL